MITEETKLYIQSDQSKFLHANFHGARLSMELIYHMAETLEDKLRGDKTIMCLKTGKYWR